MNIFHEKVCKFWHYLKLEKMFETSNEFSLRHPELKRIWKKNFRQMIRYSSDRTFPIAEEFLSVKIDKIKECNSCIKNDRSPIVICALKNEINKISFFMKHYRSLGIKHFVFLDNMSTDGTFEFLLEQEDATLYRCEHPFTADRKIAWMNRLVAECGVNKWYLMVDSDEFVTYIGRNQNDINQMVSKCVEKGYKRVGGAMLDMYPKETLFEVGGGVDFFKKYCYLDKDTYTFSKAANGIRIVGGPRKRMFGTNMKLSKFCLFYFEEGDIIPSAHFLIPFEKSYDVPVSMAILHYKFVNESDYEKMIEAVQTGMHSNGSAEYRTYFDGIKENPQITFWDEKHSMLFTEENLCKIDFLDNIFV